MPTSRGSFFLTKSSNLDRLNMARDLKTKSNWFKNSSDGFPIIVLMSKASVMPSKDVATGTKDGNDEVSVRGLGDC